MADDALSLPASVTASESRRLTGGASADEVAPDLQHRRRKAREYVKRTYDKKKNTIVALRGELAQLESQYKTILEARQLAEEDGDSDGTGANDSVATPALLYQRYTELTVVKQVLYREHEELRELHADRMILGDRLQQIIDVDGPPSITEIPFIFRSLPEEEYYQEILNCRDRALRFVTTSRRVTSGIEFCGWRDYRQVLNDDVEFAIEKCVEGTSTFELMQRTWRIMTQPQSHSTLFSASLHPELSVLRQINDDTVLCHWTFAPSNHSAYFKMIYLVARLQIEDGFMIACQSIDKDRVGFSEDDGLNNLLQPARQAQDGSQAGPGASARTVYWAEMSTWILFRDVGVNKALYHFGGRSRANVWMLEVLLVAMRWENVVMRRPLLTASSPLD